MFYFYLTGDSVAARPRWLLIVREEGWCDLELETKVHTMVRNHGEVPYKSLLLVESRYYRFHI